MSYTIDVYRGQVKATKNFIDFATYTTLFPQLVAGPIVRYKSIESELKHRTTNLQQITAGISRFVIGLAKKLIISNNCGFLADNIFSLHKEDLSSPLAWLGIIAYSLQIYFDFSGYTDMAIGLGKMFGFNFPENFNIPYSAKTVREFWKRWHITLSQWFRDYIYIPLGGNRTSNLRTYFNLFIVFFLTGLWHGANWTFIIWGIIHGIFIISEKLGLATYLSKLPNFVAHMYLLLIVLFSWVFFRSDTINDALNYINAMLSFNTKTNMAFLNYYLTFEVGLSLLLAIFFATPLPQKLILNIKTSISQKTYNSVKLFSLISLYILCFFYISIDAYNPFIYFRF
ncbi:MBOAT family O-acyltransferase [Formosa sp. S-31]|uniref:MBOAT family O-acyltransferase n=1 Tax=Formosa sp. S-31 TaxID=2790949 RepID=UPI003EB8E338